MPSMAVEKVFLQDSLFCQDSLRMEHDCPGKICFETLGEINKAVLRFSIWISVVIRFLSSDVLKAWILAGASPIL